jgi:hypothetical protein
MTNGELLFKTLQARGLVIATDWNYLLEADRDRMELVAGEFMQLADSLGPQTYQKGYDQALQDVNASPPVQNLKAQLQKYGRHLPTCQAGAPCTCGFAEVEKELAA